MNGGHMSRLFFLVGSISLCMLFFASGCATTGDPTSGGLFGWSESKAQQRQVAARTALEKEERRGDELRAEKQRLQNQINSKKRQLSSLKQKSEGSSAAQSASDAAQISRLEKEIDELTKEALALMDM